MADIKNQLVKDTYNYVLQSDLSTGYVYRIGGDVPVNPIFSSGLTILENFKYSNGTEQNGYVLYSDGVGNAYWGAISGSTSGGTISGDFLPLSGGTVTGNTIFTSGLTATTISATTYLNLPTTSGLQYYVSASTPTATLVSGDRWFNTNTGIELVFINDGDSSQWIQPFSVPGPLSPDVGYYNTTGVTTGQTLTWDKTYWGVSGNSNVDLILPLTTGKEGYYLIIKDEAGICGTYRIRLTPSSGTIDKNNYVDMNINFLSLTCMVRDGNWFLI